MKNTPIPRCASLAMALLLLLLLALLALAPARAQNPPAAAGAGFADPGGLPARAPFRDVEPVYRAPAIDTLATIRRRGTLRVGVVPVEPMVMRDRQGELVGFSVDLARRLAQDMGVEIEFVSTSWTDIVPDLLGRRFDLIATGFWLTVQRALVVNYSDVTAVEGVYLVASKGLAPGRTLVADFDRPDITLSVQPGSSQEATARKLFPRARLLVSGDDALSQVMQGHAHATLLPTLAPQAVVQTAPDKLYLPRETPLAVTPAALAVRKGDPDFLNFLNTWLSVRRDEGWLEARAAHWATTTLWMQ